MRLRQGQLWKSGEQYWRIVHLDRQWVEYKSFNDPITRQGSHQQVSKKEFCRLIRQAIPVELNPEEAAPPQADEKPQMDAD